jgi:hypothetical protein
MDYAIKEDLIHTEKSIRRGGKDVSRGKGKNSIPLKRSNDNEKHKGLYTD